MRILMLTNTYRPHVGGVARSVMAFEEEYRRVGHEVLTVAPEFDTATDDEPHVIRVPAIQHFNGSDFSLPVPAPGLAAAVDEFQPQVIHSHHPFFMGGTAMRLARARNLPLVFTHHTMYDQYTHYASADSPAAARFAAALSAGYANMCDAVIAPSQSVAALLTERGVETRIEVIPTGVDVGRFAHGEGLRARSRQGIPPEAFVVGHVGRLAPEKNLNFLARAVASFLEREERAHFLVVGSGPCEAEIRAAFDRPETAERLHLAGICEGQELIDAYHAMDAFAFASQTETQGMVLTEAMAASVPVVALDGPGVRDVLLDGVNGRLLPIQSRRLFVQALSWIAARPVKRLASLQKAARATAERFSMPRQGRRALRLYESLLDTSPRRMKDSPGPLSRARGRIEAEWSIWSNWAQAATRALEPQESH
jgi:glycosyltransferase involved in cell wall biosynthesis